jgi:hypothetical protein
MLEPLHLDGARVPVAVLLDGPALRLRRSGIADVFAPLRRLSRVLVHGPRVQWRTEALMACAEAGVPVLLMGQRGRLASVLVPVSAPGMRRDLAATLELAASRPGFRGRLEDFCRAEQRQAILAALRSEGRSAEGLDLRPARVRGLWLGPAAEEALWPRLCGLGEALVAEGLSRRGVGGQFLARRSGCFPLPAMLGEALALRLGPALGRVAGALSRCDEAEAARAVIRLFERADLEPQRDQMLNRLAVLLAAEV